MFFRHPDQVDRPRCRSDYAEGAELGIRRSGDGLIAILCVLAVVSVLALGSLILMGSLILLGTAEFLRRRVERRTGIEGGTVA